MNNHPSARRPLFRMVSFVVVALTALLGVSVALPAARTAAIAAPRPAPRRTAQAPLVPGGTPLPIFHFDSPNVSDKDAFGLSQRFSGIAQRQQALQDTYLGRPRFTVPNTQTGALLEQYGATGGFYAYNAVEAFGESARGPIDPTAAKALACTFLTGNSLLPPEAPPAGFCDGSVLPYYVVPAHATNQGAGMSIAATDSITIGLIVQVPLALNTGQYSQVPSVPLGGPGGHLSLLFRTTSPDNGFSLDNSVPGLGAVALPWYGRSYQFLRNVPAVDPATLKQQVTDRVRAAYPGASSVNVPDPVLEYMVSDAADDQQALEPDLTFQGIEVTVDGQTLVLRDISVPAVESGAGGFGPSVSITAPGNASTFVPGSSVAFTGGISDGTAPYTYTWSLDDGTVLGTGTRVSAGSVGLTTSQLPVLSHNGMPVATVVHLHVQDGDGAEREAVVSVVPATAPSLFMPLMTRSGAASALAAAPQPQPAGPISIASSNYSFGVEMGSDYPPYGPGGPDLPGVPPDAVGFRIGLEVLGWTRVFHWSNSTAWERDWRDCSLGGGDCTYGVDRADFVYYSGHGSNGGISLPSSVDSSWFPGDNARFQRARWVGFSSCLTLRAQPNDSTAPIRKWFNSFQGAHMLLGFNSVMGDIAFGPRLIDNMRIPTFFGIPFPSLQRTIREGWVLTAFEMNAGKPAYIYAIGTNGVNPVNNKLPQPGDPLLPRPYPVASWHWVWWDDS